ncbi:flagellar biosynthesis anti-sigma factor FlgM [Geomonas nitrogeniifigens]|uniref:Anti-sigma-28 factor n=1 Tax=Geomonas diazotrophica TaxID=2843197 RepID=A0ABX8JHQ8_9BACT|nr:flagellar biosynthesis anti-sigma factor FlgM [Geomonas nitrogeniifigens]QWV96189.1 flagellar biosynthesis anti-sigma factor FlgM [Geomonas nitrogeniifigens]QXE85256.1 flagellar biosynthesis anti-sigma factor FlgM [Geomonas nitrogeniifigens]
MNITDKIEQAKPAIPVEGRMDTAPRTRAQQSGRRPERQQDLVELSTSLSEISTKELDQQQARRVAAIKAQIQSGEYRVDSRQVAEKMLSAETGV